MIAADSRRLFTDRCDSLTLTCANLSFAAKGSQSLRADGEIEDIAHDHQQAMKLSVPEQYPENGGALCSFVLIYLDNYREQPRTSVFLF
jgi:hypothetical protein